jgi:hypothetical protein
MKKTFVTSLIAVVVIVTAYLLFFKEPTFTARNGFLNNINENGVIIEGYDAVAYFTDNKPLMGEPKLDITVYLNNFTRPIIS